MPVPLSVMQAAAQGDRKAMRLVEQEYGVGNGQNYAIDWLSEEEPPPRVPTGVKGIEHPTRYESRYQYPYDGRKQVREAEAKALAEKISRLKKKSDIQDVLLKVAAEDTELAEQTARELMIGGITLTTGALTGGYTAGAGLASPLYGSMTESALLGGIGATAGALPGSLMGAGIGDAISPYASRLSPPNNSPESKELEARRRMKSIELSPEAQKIYDEYKAKGYSPTYYKTK